MPKATLVRVRRFGALEAPWCVKMSRTTGSGISAIAFVCPVKISCSHCAHHLVDNQAATVNNAELYLLQREPGSAPIKDDETVRSYQRHWTPVHLDFLCKDVNQVVARVKECGGLHEGGDSGD